jgi:hypothetical protein
MQFQVNDRDYFLTFAEEEHCWYLLAETAQGLQRVPVYVDGAKQERTAFGLRSAGKTS